MIASETMQIANFSTSFPVNEESANGDKVYKIRGSLNRVHLIGTLVADPVVKEISNGAQFTSMRVVTSERIKKGENWEEISTFHNIVSFNNDVANLAKKNFLSKGFIVSVEGKLGYRETKKDEITITIPQIMVTSASQLKVIYGTRTVAKTSPEQ